MMEHRRTRRLVGAAILGTCLVGATAVRASALAVGRVSPNRPSDITLAQAASADESSNSVYTLTVTNLGPGVAHGVQVRVDLSGDYISFESIHPGSWSCPEGPIPGPTTVICALTASIGTGGGGHTATVAVTAGPGSTSHAIAGVDGVDPDCSPSFFCDGAGSNNETWGVFGTHLSFGPEAPFDATPSISIDRPTSADISGVLLAPGSSSAVSVPPPCSPTCLTDQQWIVETPATSPYHGDLMTMEISFVATSRPAAEIYQFDHDSSTWVTYGSCRGGTSVPCVKSVCFYPETDTVEITVLTDEFSHWTR